MAPSQSEPDPAHPRPPAPDPAPAPARRPGDSGVHLKGAEENTDRRKPPRAEATRTDAPRPEREADPVDPEKATQQTARRPRDEVVIEVKNVTSGYGDGQVVLRDVSLTVRRGEVMVILGGSGCGKSTLLKHMIGLLPPTSGEVRVLGVDVVSASEREMEELYKRIGIVYQSGALYGSLTVAENVALPMVEHTTLDRKIIDISVRMKLGLVNLSGFEDRLPSELSGGQIKRVAFARAIAMDPQVLFCDEPSAGLDPRIARGLDDLIRNLNAAFDMAIVVVTHEMESVRLIADRITMLAPMPGGARVVFQGTYDELLKSDAPVVRDFVARAPLTEPRTEAKEVLRALVGEAGGKA